jgi:hypothetical protein
LLLPGFRTLAASNAEATAKLFTRYENGAGGNRLIEDVLTLTLSVSNKDRTKVAIRVCSKEPIPFALATAGANPFRIAELLSDSYGYSPEQVIFLRSENCLSSKNPSRSITEVWAVPQGAQLPPHDEALTSNQVRLTSLGKEQANRGVRDYKTALQKLIQDLRANPLAVGVIFGYFLERPSSALQRRLREVTRTLEQSGLPRERYLVSPKAWDDEISTYPPDSEPTYPSVFVVDAKPSR